MVLDGSSSDGSAAGCVLRQTSAGTVTHTNPGADSHCGAGSDTQANAGTNTSTTGTVTHTCAQAGGDAHGDADRCHTGHTAHTGRAGGLSAVPSDRNRWGEGGAR